MGDSLAQPAGQGFNVLALLSTDGVGRRTAAAVAPRLLRDLPESPSDLSALLLDEHARGRRVELAPPEDIEEGMARAETILGRARAAGCHVLTTLDEGFPQELRLIPDPPAAVYLKGSPAALAPRRSVAVVGTREPSDYGRRCAFRFGERLAEQGLVTVSGLALGIDTAAHEGALRGGGVTLAVLAHGLDTVYPSANRGLARRIVEAGGALLSEYAPGVGAEGRRFVERDRIQSGLSRAVIAVETGLKGGTQHTVRFARLQGRPLATIVHPETYAEHPAAAGPRKLVADGRAAPLRSRADLDSFLAAALGASAGDRLGLTDEEVEWVRAHLDADPLARAVAERYEMVRACPADPGARGLLEAEIARMRAARAA